mmetsp:Transcript_46951/g.106449  ORF Transcript_46951/g.106449 Transcript_46951/m.106449 type:complete len:225 (+) Transcript_46951:66-740(+)
MGGLSCGEGPELETRFLLVRHGETDWNKQQRLQGQLDVPLNDEGRRQAEEIGQWFRSVAVDRVISSPLSRATQTASAILAGHPHVTLETDPGFQEFNLGKLQGMYLQDPECRKMCVEREGRLANGEDAHYPEGENDADVVARATAGLQRAAKGGTIVVVAHGGTIRAVVKSVYSREGWSTATLPAAKNCSVTELVWRPGVGACVVDESKLFQALIQAEGSIRVM